jgi:adenylate kinase family enzyme
MKTQRIHIFGASGSGTTTLGKALANTLSVTFFDADDYYWQKTEPPFTRKVPTEQRVHNLLSDLSKAKNWVLSGSVVGWGDKFIPLFTLAIFTTLPHDLRLERLHAREVQRYGQRVEVGGDMYETSQAFLDWASKYDTAGLEQRSLVTHERWLQKLSCPVLHIQSMQSVELIVGEVLNFLKPA